MVAILKAMATGAIAFSVIAAPQMAQTFEYFGILEGPKNKKKLLRKLQAMEQHGYIFKTRVGYRVSLKGKKTLTEDELWETTSLPKKDIAPYLHVCLFDIPVKKNKGRWALRAILTNLGYEKYQNSVFVSRYDYQNFLEKFATFYGVQKYVRFLKAKDFTRY